jgi:hypothetical protein
VKAILSAWLLGASDAAAEPRDPATPSPGEESETPLPRGVAFEARTGDAPRADPAGGEATPEERLLALAAAGWGLPPPDAVAPPPIALSPLDAAPTWDGEEPRRVLPGAEPPSRPGDALRPGE